MTAVVKKIVDWINEEGRPVWWRHTVRLVLMKGQLDDESLGLICKIAQMEVGYIKQTELFPDYTASVSSAGYEGEKKSVVLGSIGPMSNVASLVSDQILPFEEVGITVIYGDNGSGKSSYARILKNACLARGDIEEVVGNVFLDSDETPSAVINFLYGDEDKSQVWLKGGDEISELKSIRVFDAQSSLHYVEKEGLIEFKPFGIHLLDELIRAQSFVKDQADEALIKYGTPIQLPDIPAQTKVGLFVASISAKTSDEELEANIVTEEELETLPVLQQELYGLKSRTAEQLRLEVKKKRDRIKLLSDYIHGCLESLSGKEFKELLELQSGYFEQRTVLEKLKGEVFSDDLMAGIGGDSWRELWAAAESYMATIGKPLPLSVADDCPLCLQEISEATASELRGFHSYIHNEITQKVAMTEKALEHKKRNISRLTISIEQYQPVIDEVTEVHVDFDVRVSALMVKLSKRKDNILSEKVVDDLLEIDIELSEFITSYVLQLENNEKSFSSDEALSNKIKNTEVLVDELNAKKLFTDNKENYSREISRKSKFTKIREIVLLCNTSAITRLSSEINQEEVIDNLRSKFLAELKELGFKSFQVETATRGVRGNQMLKIEIPGLSLSPSAIASEGEQKCLALASFMAEIESDQRKSAIILDDPVNSLAHRWRGKFAQRIVRAAKERQVIIFSHDLPFIKILEEYANGNLVIRAVDRVGQNSGNVLAHPHWDTMNTKSRIGALKQDLVKLKKSSESDNDQTYHENVKKFYTKKRGAWERLVEEWLIKKVVERFGRSVSTQPLKYLIDIQQSDVDLVETAMSKCSTIFDGHDTAAEFGVYVVPYDDVETDLMELDTYFTGIKKRRA